MQVTRTVRYQGLVVRDADVVNYLVLSAMPRDAAERHAAKAPTWDGEPMDGGAFIDAMHRTNRAASLHAMSFG